MVSWTRWYGLRACDAGKLGSLCLPLCSFLRTQFVWSKFAYAFAIRVRACVFCACAHTFASAQVPDNVGFSRSGVRRNGRAPERVAWFSPQQSKVLACWAFPSSSLDEEFIENAVVAACDRRGVERPKDDGSRVASVCVCVCKLQRCS